MKVKYLILMLLVVNIVLVNGCAKTTTTSAPQEKITSEEIKTEEEKFYVRQDEVSKFLKEGQSYLYTNGILYKAIRVPEENKVYIYKNESVEISTKILKEEKVYIYVNETLIPILFEPQEEQVIIEPLPEEQENLTPIYPFTISFRSQDFNIIQKVDPDIQAKIGTQNYTFAYIKLGGKNPGSRLNILTDLGISILTYSQNSLYGVKLPLNKLSEIKNLSFVHWIGNFDPIIKLDKELRDFIDTNSSGKVSIQIKLFEKDTHLSEDKNIIKTKSYKKGENGTLIEEITYGCIGDYGRILEGININISHRYCGDYYIAIVYPNATQEITKLEFVDFITYSPAESVI